MYLAVREIIYALNIPRVHMHKERWHSHRDVGLDYDGNEYIIKICWDILMLTWAQWFAGLREDPR